MAQVTVLEIGGDRWRVGVLPETGACLAYGQVRSVRTWRDVLRPTRTAALTKPLWCASSVLVPFSHRVRGGVLRFGDRSWQLRRSSGDGHAMHGTGFEFSWDVVERTDRTVRMALDAGAVVGANFPWTFRAEVAYTVEGARLTIATALTNTDGEPFPAGFGHRPYFRRGLVDPAVSEVRVQIPAEGAYAVHDAIPDGPAGPVAPRVDFRAVRPLHDGYLNECYARGAERGPVRLEWPTAGVAVSMSTDPVFAHTLVHAPLRRPYFAVEPVTDADDGFSLMADGVPGHGVFVLGPGETRCGDVTLDVTDLTG